MAFKPPALPEISDSQSGPNNIHSTPAVIFGAPGGYNWY
jgi:hypothetical protein